MVVAKSPDSRQGLAHEVGRETFHADPRTTSPLRQKGRGALMAAAAAEQKGILIEGGQVSDQFANWRNVKSRVRAGGKLATMALQLQQTLGSTPAFANPKDVAIADQQSPEARSKRSAHAAGMSSPTREGAKRRAGTTPTKAARCQQRKPLPPKYAQLEVLFRALEGVCSLLALRKKSCTFENVKKPLEDTTGRRFTLLNLAQLVGVYPEAFSLHYESPRRASTASIAPGLLLNAPTSPRPKWELRIDLQPVPSATEESCEDTEVSPTSLDTQSVGPQEQSRRRIQGFRERLVHTAETAHCAFLDRNNLPYADFWHPSFDLDTVPDIPCASLPPLPRSKPPTSAELNPFTASGKPAEQQKTLQGLPPTPKRISLSLSLPGSPSSPLKPRPAVKIGSPSAVGMHSPRPPTPRSLARTFDSVAEAPVSENPCRGEPVGSPQMGGTFEAVLRGEAAISGTPISGTPNNPLRVPSASEKGFESGLRSSSSETDSDCCVIASEMGHISASSPTVWLRDGGRANAAASLEDSRADAAASSEGGRVNAAAAHNGGNAAGGGAAAAGLRGVPIDIVQQLSEREQRAKVAACPTAVAGRERRTLLGQLPGLVNQLRAVASAEGRGVMRKEQLLAHLVKGNPRTVDQGELTAQLSLLQELAPGFLSSPTSAASATPLIRVNVKTDFAALKKTLARAT